MNSEICKKEIVRHCAENIWELYTHWVPDDGDYENPRTFTAEQVCWLLNPNNWSRREKRKAHAFETCYVFDLHIDDFVKISAEGCIVREFDCEPFDDQMRATVYERDGKIVCIEARGE